MHHCTGTARRTDRRTRVNGQRGRDALPGGRDAPAAGTAGETGAWLRSRTVPEESGHLLAAEGERDELVAMLRVHFQAGRLDVGEFEERLERAFAARTRGQLGELVRDLPVVASPRAAAARRREAVGGALPYAAVMVGLVMIWALSGAGYFWPIWPMLGWGIPVALHRLAALGGWSDDGGAPERSNGAPV